MKWYRRRSFWVQLGFGGCALLAFGTFAVSSRLLYLGVPMLVLGITFAFVGLCGVIICPKSRT